MKSNSISFRHGSQIQLQTCFLERKTILSLFFDNFLRSNTGRIPFSFFLFWLFESHSWFNFTFSVSRLVSVLQNTIVVFLKVEDSRRLIFPHIFNQPFILKHGALFILARCDWVGFIAYLDLLFFLLLYLLPLLFYGLLQFDNVYLLLSKLMIDVLVVLYLLLYLPVELFLALKQVLIWRYHIEDLAQRCHVQLMQARQQRI